MEYDPKSYYPGRYMADGAGKRKKQVLSWESIEPSELDAYELVAVNCEENGFFVIDLDDTTDAAAKFIAETGLNLTGTRKVQTQGGGFHWYFETPDDIEIPRLIGAVVGIDILGTGMVFAPPSDGYAVREGGHEIAEPPERLVEAIKALSKNRRGAKGNRAGEPPTTGPVMEGRRNDQLFRQGLALRKKHNLDQRDIESVLRRENAERCNPPLDEQEIGALAASVAGYEGDMEAPEPAGPLEFSAAVLRNSQFMALELPPHLRLAGPFFSPGLSLIVGPANVGKSPLLQAIAAGLLTGDAIGERWAVQGEWNPLLIECEMPASILQARWRINPAELLVCNRYTMREYLGIEFDLARPGMIEALTEFCVAEGVGPVLIDNAINSTKPTADEPMYSAQLWRHSVRLNRALGDHNIGLIIADHSARAKDRKGAQGSQVKLWDADTVGVMEEVGRRTDDGFRFQVHFEAQEGGKTRHGWEDIVHSQQRFKWGKFGGLMRYDGG